MRYVGLCLILAATLAFGEDAAFRYYVDIGVASLEELDRLFSDLQESLGESPPAATIPVVVVLHGDEAHAFIRSNYAANRTRVDTAALLDAHGVVDMKMCATWMRNNAITDQDIPPFIETVPFGPGEVTRLRNEGYLAAPKVRL
jgi:uncharacterized protein